MTERLAAVEARIGTVHKLAAVISAMRGIAASRTQEARRHVDSIRIFTGTIGDAIGHALTLLPETDRVPTGNGPTGRQAIILLAAEQGFAGAFSERVFDAAAGLMRTPYNLLIAGDRGLLVAEERGLSVDWACAMIAHPAQAAALATRLTGAIYERLARADVSRVAVIHAAPGGAEGVTVVTKQLVPFDYTRFPISRRGVAPRVTLPPGQLLARLVEEYVFAELSEAVMLSFAAENEARMRAMNAAHDNVSDSLTALISTSRRLRQEEITDEIVELATSGLPVR